MEINVEWQEGQYPSFNLILSSKVGVDPFITIKGCGIMQGSKGEFVKYPSKKLDSGKWFNYIYANDKFNSAVLEKAHAAKKDIKVKTVQDMDSDLPF